MRKEPLNSKRINLINRSTQELFEDVNELSEGLIDGEFELSMKKLEDLKNKIRLIQDMVREGHILKIK